MICIKNVYQNFESVSRDRQREGIEAAKKRGVHMGRPAKPVPDDFAEILDRLEKREITAAAAAQLCGFSRSTLYEKKSRLVRKRNTNNETAI